MKVINIYEYTIKFHLLMRRDLLIYQVIGICLIAN